MSEQASSEQKKEHHGFFEDVLEAFNAGGVIEHPGEPTTTGAKDDPTSDAKAPAP